MITVELTELQLLIGKQTGHLRHSCSKELALKDNKGFSADEKTSIANSILGAQAEIALAVHLERMYVPFTNTFKTCADVGQWQVRQTNHANGCLAVFDQNDRFEKYVLVTTTDNKFNIIGWQFGCYVIDNFPLKELSPGMGMAHWCPQNHLIPAETIMSFENQFRVEIINTKI